MIGYRKYSAAAVFLISSILLRIFGYIPGDNWLSEMTIAMVAFFGANLSERIVEKFRGK